MTDERGLVQSVRTRLLNEAKRRGLDPNLALARYGIERFLYRLSHSRYRDQFVLKGAMMMLVWLGDSVRPTKDADLLGFGDLSTRELTTIFGDICTADVPPDGMRYDPESIRIIDIREDDAYGGRRIRLLGMLGVARVPIQIDVGIGDAVSPPPEWVDLPALLGSEAPRLRGYRPETAIAEKFHAMLERGEANSRMKDYFDIIELARSRPFDGIVLEEAIRSTLKRRRTRVPDGVPVAMAGEFAASRAKQIQWRAFVRKSGLDAAPEFAEVVRQVREFLQPVIEAIASKRDFESSWNPGGPWQTRGRGDAG